MTLAGIDAFSSDLRVFLGKSLVDFYTVRGYANHNNFRPETVFPLALRPFFKKYPRFTDVGRWGRHIFMKFDTCTVVFNMADGTAFFAGKADAEVSIDRRWISACGIFTSSPTDTKEYLFFIDENKRGFVNVYPAHTVPAEFSYLGMDITDSAFTYQYLSSTMTRRCCVKGDIPNVVSFLTDPRVLAGIDGPTLSESLFMASINPNQKILRIEEDKVHILSKALPIICRRFIDGFKVCGNSSEIKDCAVYGRSGQKCASCGRKIEKGVVSGVLLYWCPKCQSLKSSTVGSTL